MSRQTALQQTALQLLAAVLMGKAGQMRLPVQWWQQASMLRGGLMAGVGPLKGGPRGVWQLLYC